MLDSQIVREIEELVYKKPRSMQEIAQHIKRNWRTADRYVEEIEKEWGTIATRVFRGGTKGALKIAYWASVEKLGSSLFQENLEKEILLFKKKEEFSAFDLFQHVGDKQKKAIVEEAKSDDETNLGELGQLLSSAQKQLLIFSGNLSFINNKNKDFDALKIFEDLIKKKVSIKIICRVDFAGKENIERILSLNYKLGKDAIEIRHREQPVRAYLIDNKIARLKEVKEPTGRAHELNKKMYLFYTIKDKEWVEWLSKVFWKMYSSSIGAQKRLEELSKIKLIHK